MQAHARWTLLLPALAAAAPACGDRADWITRPQALSGPVVLGTRLYWADSFRREVVAVDPAAEQGGARVRRIPLGGRATGLSVVPGADPSGPPRGIALLTPDRHQLVLLSEDEATGVVTLREFDVEQGYDRLRFSADGRYGLAWMGEGADQRDLLSIVSAVAVLDVEALVAGDEDAIHEVTLNLEEAPRRVEFSGALAALDRDSPPRLAAVITSARIAMLDLARPQARARTIFLDPNVHPDVVRFTDGVAPDAGAEFLLFSSVDSAASDRGISAYRIQLAPEADGAEAAGEPRIRLNYDLLLPADPPSHFQVFPDPSRRKHLVVSVGAQASRATIIEVGASAGAATVTLPDNMRASYVHRAALPGRELAVLYEQTGDGQGREPRLGYIDMDAAAQGRAEATAGEAFAAPVRRLDVVPHHPGRLLVHLHDSAQIELLDLAGDKPRSTSIRLQTRAEALWDSQGGSFYVVSGDGNRLGRVTLGEAGALSSETLDLDNGAGVVHLLEGAGLVIVDHGAPQGMVTVVPAGALTRDRARVIEGFFVEGLLDLAGGRDDE